MFESFSQRNLGREAKVSFQGRGVSVSGRYITGLHGNELLVGFEVVVLWQDTCSYKLLLQNVYKVEQVLGLAATDVIDCVRRYRQAVFACLLFGSFGHHTDNAFDNVINVCEIPAAIAVVVNLDCLAFK